MILKSTIDVKCNILQDLKFCIYFSLILKLLKADAVQKATVYKENNQFVLKVGSLDKDGLAYGVYNDSFMSTGWGVLDVKAGYSSKSYDENDVAYAAGYLEGYLTSR